MATISDICKGLQILQSYYDGERSSVSAEHDQIFAGCSDMLDISKEDLATLEDLGWSINEEFLCWSHFT